MEHKGRWSAVKEGSQRPQVVGRRNLSSSLYIIRAGLTTKISIFSQQRYRDHAHIFARQVRFSHLFFSHIGRTCDIPNGLFAFGSFNPDATKETPQKKVRPPKIYQSETKHT
eukprot:scaffold1803_cov92-Amphora_coffeaeformis.AAC.86